MEEVVVVEERRAVRAGGAGWEEEGVRGREEVELDHETGFSSSRG